MTTYPDLTDPSAGSGADAPRVAAMAAARAYCRWHIAPSVTETVVLDSIGGGVIVLPSLFVTAVSAVVVKGTTYTTDQFEWSEAGILTGCWPVGLRAVSVTFTHGYATCPQEVADVVVAMTKAGVSGGSSSVQVGQVRVSSAPQSSAGALGVDTFAAQLDRYRIPNLA